VKLLLDTHALIWWWLDDAQLSAAAREAIADPGNEVWVSAASAWEIATKQRLGKLGDLAEASTRFVELVAADGFRHLPIQTLHALRAGSHQALHRDPFDRMLAAQAELERAVLVSRDEAFAGFGVRVLW
jgi:PIN domain nuclease of toxin-antitoxin system